MRKILIASIITVFAMLEALAQTPGEFARKVCGVSETDTVAVVPRGVKEIPDYGFYGLSSLRRVELPEGVEKIGRSAFAWCDSLREVRLPKSLTDIGAHAFAYCERMERADLPPRLRHIGNNAFSRCLALRSAEVPASVTELESYAFSDCVSLRRATLPANKSLLGELIFSGCLNLRELRCMSPVPPPFDCASFIFEPDEETLYRRCVLVVPATGAASYRDAHGWSLFRDISAEP